MKISARNVLKGKVVKLTKGAVNAEIVIELAGGAQVTSIITLDSASRLGLADGKAVYAIVKASDVMVGID
jgi:molybdopterin-binding protein